MGVGKKSMSKIPAMGFFVGACFRLLGRPEAYRDMKLDGKGRNFRSWIRVRTRLGEKAGRNRDLIV